MAMAAGTVPDCTDLTPQTDEGPSLVQQVSRTEVEVVEDRLGTLKENIHLCNQVLVDLEDLRGLLVRKSLQDVSLPQQK
ncbi:uncharacterized protein ACO6RY_12821 [Pungitius sinensis]